jgi:hypothetical protein
MDGECYVLTVECAPVEDSTPKSCVISCLTLCKLTMSVEMSLNYKPDSHFIIQ